MSANGHISASGPVDAIIFDMDGVLIDAREWHYEALNRALGLFGFGISRYEHLTAFDGLPTSKKLDLLSMERGLPRELHEFIAELKQTYTLETVHARCKPQFIHEFALSRLKAAGYKLAVASNSIRETVQLMMMKANLDQYLELQLSNQDVSRPKPDPEIYLTAMARLAVEPSRCLVVEDNENGVRAAAACGAHVMVVRDPRETTLANILRTIARIAGAQQCPSS